MAPVGGRSLRDQQATQALIYLIAVIATFLTIVGGIVLRVLSWIEGPPKRTPGKAPDETMIHLFANFVVIIARLIATAVTLIIWTFIIGPTWLALLLRTIVAYSAATALSLFSFSAPPTTTRLNAIAGLWVRGVGRIFAALSATENNALIPPPISFMEALKEVGLAILFYCGLISTVLLLGPIKARFFPPSEEQAHFLFDQAEKHFASAKKLQATMEAAQKRIDNDRRRTTALLAEAEAANRKAETLLKELEEKRKANEPANPQKPKR